MMEAKLKGAQTLFLTGNYAAAYAAKAARVQVVAAYPITPQTTIVEKISEFVERGELDAKFIRVESEHSAMAACIGASAAGARAFTATSSHGLAYMHECLWWASGARLPIVMGVVNRAMGPGWNIWTDYGDTMAQRDLGWIQIYCADNQEVFNSVIQAFKFCEDWDVLLPCMVIEEAFILSHTSMAVTIPPQDEIDEFLPPRKPRWRLDVDDPLTFGALVFPDAYMEFRYLMHKAMERAKAIIPKVEEEYCRKFGFKPLGPVETYRCEDAELLIVSMGTIGYEARTAVDRLRERGIKVGVARVRVFRPFPREKLRELASNVDMVAVIDRQISLGMEGGLTMEVKSTLYNMEDRPPVAGFVLGIGGRDVTYKDIEAVGEKAHEWMRRGRVERDLTWVGLRGGQA